MTARAPHKDNPLLGIALMLGFCLIIPFGDALIKMMGQSVPLIMVLLARFVMQSLLLWPHLLRRPGGLHAALSLSKGTWWRLVIRTVMHGAGIAGMYFGLKHMPLADTTAIAFIFPILMLAVGGLFMGEQVGPHRIVAALVGFIGTLLVVQPNFVAVGLHALWPVGVAFTFVIFVLVTRQMTREIDPVAIQAISGSMAVLMLLPLLLLADDGAFSALQFQTPSVYDGWLLIASGIIGTYAHLLMAWSLKYAPSATLAPMQYLEIPFATLIGWLIFGDLPNALAALGIAVTVSAGLYMIHREQRAHRRLKAEQKQPARGEDMISTPKKLGISK